MSSWVGSDANVRRGPSLLSSNFWHYNREERDGCSRRIRLHGKILQADVQGISDVLIPLKLAQGAGQTVSYIIKKWRTILERAASLWRLLLVYPGIGVASAQGLVAVISWSPILWGFPPPDEVQEQAYFIGYLIGLWYGLLAEGPRWLRSTTQNCQKRWCPCTSLSQLACACAKCCHCKPAGS